MSRDRLAHRHRLPSGPGVHVANDARMEHLAFSLVRTTPDAPAQLRAEYRETLLVILENAGGSVTVDGRALLAAGPRLGLRRSAVGGLRAAGCRDRRRGDRPGGRVHRRRPPRRRRPT